MQETHPQHTFTQEQKTGFVLLLVFGVLTVALGFLQIRNTIYTPFVIKVSKESEVANQLSGLLDETTRLQTIDTDHDGLSDYDEINFIGTSAYLPDTDSDGISDKVEVDEGTDPTCAQEKNCSGADQIPETGQMVVESPLINEIPTAADIFGGQGTTTLPPSDSPTTDSLSALQDIAALVKNPAQLRTAIIATGQISESDLSQFSDQELVQSFQTLLDQQTVIKDITGAGSAGLPANTSASTRPNQ